MQPQIQLSSTSLVKRFCDLANMSNPEIDASHGAGVSTITTTTRTSRSIPMLLLHKTVGLFNGSLVKPKKQHPAGSPKLDVPGSARKHCTVNERTVDEINIYDLVAKRGVNVQDEPRKEGLSTRRIYYFGGGGWQMPPSGEHWKLVTEMATKLNNTAVSLVSYPLAPHSAAPIAIPMLLTLFGTLMREAKAAGDEVVLAGDSAGANVVLCLVLEALKQNPDAACPEALMCISPSVDLERRSPDIPKVAKHDPLLTIPFVKSTANAWRGDWQASDPRISPLNADVTPLARRDVRVHGVCGGYDILSPEALAFRDKCADAGVKGEWLVWDKQMHCFPLAFGYYLSEPDQAVEWILDVLRRC